MAITKVVMAINKKSSIPADKIQMSLYFDRGAAPGPADYDALQTCLNAFWNTLAAGATYKPSEYLQNSILTGAGVHEMKFYTVPVSRAALGSPVATRTMTITTVDTGPAPPAEVAVALSYQRAYGTDVEFDSGGLRPRARDRGRVFFGPISNRAIGTLTTVNDPVVNTLCTDDLVAAMKKHWHDDPLAQSWVWVHFSPTEWSWDAVTNVWVDNAFDIQRRRGIAATRRSTATL